MKAFFRTYSRLIMLIAAILLVVAAAVTILVLGSRHNRINNVFNAAASEAMFGNSVSINSSSEDDATHGNTLSENSSLVSENTSSSQTATSSTSKAQSKKLDDTAVKYIALSKTSITLQVGETGISIVTMYPTTATDKRELWSTTDNSIASVDESGYITGKKPGSCTIVIKSASNPDVSAPIQVTVVAKKSTTANNQSFDSDYVIRASCKQINAFMYPYNPPNNTAYETLTIPASTSQEDMIKTIVSAAKKKADRGDFAYQITYLGKKTGAAGASTGDSHLFALYTSE